MTESLVIEERSFGTRCCPDTEVPLDSAEAQQLSSDLQILAHPVRLQLLALLAQRAGQVCVCDLEAALPIKQPTVSHHLRLLREAGLVDCERHGQWAYYFLCREAMTAIQSRVGGLLQMLA